MTEVLQCCWLSSMLAGPHPYAEGVDDAEMDRDAELDITALAALAGRQTGSTERVHGVSAPVFPTGLRYYWKSHFVKDFTVDAIDVTLAHFANVPSPRSVVVLEQFGGAVARVAPQATAFGHRDVEYDFFPASIWTDPADSERQIAWARGLWEATKSFGTGGVYVNDLGEEGEDRVRAAYGGNYARLAALKTTYDPGNFFRLNQNVKPGA